MDIDLCVDYEVLLLVITTWGDEDVIAAWKGIVSGGTLFEELGYYYVGPVDGHDLDNLVPILENIRDKKDDKPVRFCMEGKGELEDGGMDFSRGGGYLLTLWRREIIGKIKILNENEEIQGG